LRVGRRIVGERERLAGAAFDLTLLPLYVHVLFQTVNSTLQEAAMKAFVPALLLTVGISLAAAPALAQPIPPAEAEAHAGQSVTVEGTASEVHASPSGRATFINIGGAYPNNAFTAVIFAKDAGKFSNLSALEGKIVDVSGPVQLYKGKPEIIVTDAAQLKTK
jgi:hypothetical protein